MKKTELINKINEIAQDLDEQTANANALQRDLKEIFKKVEDLPTEPEDIEDDDEEESDIV